MKKAVREMLTSLNFSRRWLAIAAGLHLAAAIYSEGFQSADEHFQILEFAAHKLGLAPVTNLPVEFGRQMRPFLLPALVTWLTELWRAFGIEDRHFWAFSYRLVSAALGWLSLAATVRAIPHWIRTPGLQRWAIRLGALLWFLPALHARPSSENWAGSLFLLALALAATPDKRKRPWLRDLGIGALLGAAFETRFQIGASVFGFLAWRLWVERTSLRALLPTLVGGLAVFGIGRVIDFWGYGAWAWSPWEYLRFNLLEGKLYEFGTSPWYAYFELAWTFSWQPLGLLLLLASLWVFARERRHPMTWAYLPLLAFHFAIGHKELRFLYPIASAASVLLPLALDRGVFTRIQSRTWARAFAVFLAIDNLLALAATTLIPAAKMVVYYRAIDRELAQGAVARKLWALEFDPYKHLGSHVDFYFPKDFGVEERRTLPELEDSVRQAAAARPQLVFLPGFDWDLSQGSAWLHEHCEPRYRTVPEALLQLKRWVPTNVRVWTLFRCSAGGPSSP